MSTMSIVQCPHCNSENSIAWISDSTVTVRTATTYKKLQKIEHEYHTNKKCICCGKIFYAAGTQIDRKNISKQHR